MHPNKLTIILQQIALLVIHTQFQKDMLIIYWQKHLMNATHGMNMYNFHLIYCNDY